MFLLTLYLSKKKNATAVFEAKKNNAKKRFFGLFSENITPLGQNCDGRDKNQLCVSSERQGYQVTQNNLKVDIQVVALLII